MDLMFGNWKRGTNPLLQGYTLAHLWVILKQRHVCYPKSLLFLDVDIFYVHYWMLKIEKLICSSLFDFTL